MFWLLFLVMGWVVRCLWICYWLNCWSCSVFGWGCWCGSDLVFCRRWRLLLLLVFCWIWFGWVILLLFICNSWVIMSCFLWILWLMRFLGRRVILIWYCCWWCLILLTFFVRVVIFFWLWMRWLLLVGRLFGCNLVFGIRMLWFMVNWRVLWLLWIVVLRLSMFVFMGGCICLVLILELLVWRSWCVSCMVFWVFFGFLWIFVF